MSARSERISLETYDACNGIVKYGPFQGLSLNRETWWGKSDLGAQCLGLYEKEILNEIGRQEKGKYQTFIDIGAADGYYAVGMLLAGIVDEVISFEISEAGRAAISENWDNNGKPGAITVYGEANHASLTAIPSRVFDGALVLIDIEGYEFELLTKGVIEQLRFSEVVIEIHNWIDDFETRYAQLLRDLSEYFTIEKLAPVDRNTSHMTELRAYTDDNRLLLVSERRPCLMRFLKLTPLKA
ncbi:MAG: hypothetical protein P8P29_00830 [Flavobacteriaceae bacterium]|nr:hypothetical protein [Flavobacteriaceae bacterium]